MSFRRAARVDDNHVEIVKAFRSMGCSVKPVHTIKNFVDVIVGLAGQNVLVEIKDGSKPPSARKLTEGEQEFHSQWKGRIEIVESIEDVQRVVRTLHAA